MALPFLPQPKQWKNCLAGTDCERTAIFRRERGTAPCKFAPPFFQLNIPADDLDNICAGQQLLDE